MSNEEQPNPPRVGIRKGVYIIPSLFTIGNIFCGFYAVINAMKAYQVIDQPEAVAPLFNSASIAIGIAFVLDGLDGRIARMTKASSEFGVELDSIADVISFGFAPAMLAFTWGYGNLSGHDQLAWAVSFFFLICGALRLARFNVLARAPRFEQPGATPKLDKKYFVGLPIPAAAGMIAAIIHFIPAPMVGAGQARLAWFLLFIVFILALLMVSTFRYTSFKDIGPRSNQPFIVIPVLTALIGSIYLYSEWMLLIMAAVYVLHGPVMKIAGLASRSRKTETAETVQSGE